jgi:Fe-S cluster assembly iron-binding protein IscA
MLKKNIFIKKISNLLLSINNRIESFFNLIGDTKLYKKKFFKLWNEYLDKKLFIPLIIIVFGVIIYFLLPAFYDKNKIKDQIKNQVSEIYNINIKFDKELEYALFPAPHFSIEEVQIESGSQIISNSKKTRFYISSKNNFEFDSIEISKLFFLETDFRINSSNFKFFIDLLNNRNSSQELRFIKNKIFYLDQNNEVIFFSDSKKIDYFYQENLLNGLNAKLDIFNLPINLEISHDYPNKNFLSKIEIDKLRINIKNNLKYKNKGIEGSINLNSFNKNNLINYSIINNNLIFNFEDQQIEGKINIKPFFLSSNLKIKNINIKSFLNKNSILVNLLKTEILNNNNLNSKINVQIEGFNDLTHVDLVKFDIFLEEGEIMISNLNFIFKDNTIFNFNNLNIVIDDNKLKFIGDLSIDFTDIQNFYNHFQITRNYRKNISQINSNFIFNFDDETFELNELNVVGIDKKISDEYLNRFNRDKKNLLNNIVFRNKVRNFFEMISLD